MTDNICPNKSSNYVCIKCKYITNNKKKFNKNNLTRKHVILTNDLQKNPQKS